MLKNRIVYYPQEDVIKVSFPNDAHDAFYSEDYFGLIEEKDRTTQEIIGLIIYCARKHPEVWMESMQTAGYADLIPYIIKETKCVVA